MGFTQLMRQLPTQNSANSKQHLPARSQQHPISNLSESRSGTPHKTSTRQRQRISWLLLDLFGGLISSFHHSMRRVFWLEPLPPRKNYSSKAEETTPPRCVPTTSQERLIELTPVSSNVRKLEHKPQIPVEILTTRSAKKSPL